MNQPVMSLDTPPDLAPAPTIPLTHGRLPRWAPALVAVVAIAAAGLFPLLLGWGIVPWILLAVIFFIAGQTYEYAALFHENLTISTNVYGSVFFLATGFHGLYVLGGLFAFMIFMGRTFLARTFTHEQAVSAVVVSYYWHFVDVVWIALFGVIYILQ